MPGASWVLDAVGFDARLARVPAVVTGEGRLDAQTFEGKLVGEVAARARAAGKPVHAVVGSTALSDAEAAALGLASVTVASDLPALRAAGAGARGGLSRPRRASPRGPRGVRLRSRKLLRQPERRVVLAEFLSDSGSFSAGRVPVTGQAERGAACV